MKMKVFLLALLCLPFAGSAQYVTSGKIEYERRVNLHRSLENMDDDDGGNSAWMDMIKAKMPQFLNQYFNLSFSQENSLFTPGKEVELPKMDWGLPPGADDVVATDFKSNKVVATKQIYETKFLIQDSMRKLPWRIMNEIRTIAGYKCRKAVTKICDSVYVVAFYTDDIAVSGGPEQFGGLPGMILELAVPRLYTTWTAIKVDAIIVKESDLAAVPAKGKKVTQAELGKSLKSSLKDWGKWGHRTVWWALI